jgi:outer membrane biosynthesis protein TonB
MGELRPTRRLLALAAVGLIISACSTGAAQSEPTNAPAFAGLASAQSTGSIASASTPSSSTSKTPVATPKATPTVKPKPKPTVKSTPKSTTKRTTSKPTTKPKPSPKPTPAIHGVHPGAFCSQHWAIGYTSAGTRMRCETTATDTRFRWRAY